MTSPIIQLSSPGGTSISSSRQRGINHNNHRGETNNTKNKSNNNSNKNSNNHHPRCQNLIRWIFGLVLFEYTVFIFIWQHRHLTEHTVDFATLLSQTKDAFMGEPSLTNVSSFAIGGNINTTDAETRSGPKGHSLSHRPAHIILQNPKLPDWVKHYASWHKAQRRRYLDSKTPNSTVNADDVKFLLSRCLSQDKCGGASDRLQDMPYNLLLANRTSRVLLVRWEKPAPLQNFLVPPPDHGIDWTCEGDIYDALVTEGDWHLRGKETNGRLRVVSTVRRDSGAPIFRKYENDVVGHKIYHEIFRLLFSPSPSLAARVDTTMHTLHLTPHQYSSVHLRVKYPVRGVDEHSFTFEKHKHQITQWATNAVNCAAELHPNSTIYVSSDNNDTVGYLLEESHFAQHYIDATRHKKHPLVIQLVARDYSNENEHVAFSNNREADGFMSVFEDLMIMGMGKCVAHGVGGYGRLGAALSGGECAVAHRGRHSRVCSNALASIEKKIDT
mmetsp:Transcript_18467/g.38801  ORF Transcript_18467/g.38801 Transcript_18467/m.38801 type:complete len:499 (+) Transcript_18467:302-1798(+)